MTTDADLRRIKRQLHAQPQRLKVHCGRGLRDIVKDEIDRILASAVEPQKFLPIVDPAADGQAGGIVVENLGFRNALEIAVRCGGAKEILLEVGLGRADTAKNAQKVLRDVPWALLLKSGERLALRVTSLRSRLFHEGALKDSAGKMLGGLGFEIMPQTEARTVVDLRLVDNALTVALSVPGAHLPRRGYKVALKALAPLREDLAAAGAETTGKLARRVHGGVWKAGRIVAPFAGSGTLGFESTRAFLNMAPSLFRDDWPFLAAPCAPEKTVAHLFDALRARIDPSALSAPVVFIEKDADQCRHLRANCAAFHACLVAQGVDGVAFEVIEADVFSLDTKAWGGEPVFLAVNPPYGIRLEDRGSVEKLYKKLGLWIAALGGAGPVTGFLVGRTDDLERAAAPLGGIFVTEFTPFMNGGLKLGILAFTVRPTTAPRSNSGDR